MYLCTLKTKDMDNRYLQKEADNISSIIDKLIDEINSLEQQVWEKNKMIEKQEDRIFQLEENISELKIKNSEQI